MGELNSSFIDWQHTDMQTKREFISIVVIKLSLIKARIKIQNGVSLV